MSAAFVHCVCGTRALPVHCGRMADILQASASRVVALTLLRFGGTVLLAPHDSAYVAGLDLMAAASSAACGVTG